jgi:putative addiction module component (TIGR02574 family)
MNKKLFTDILELSVPERLQLVQDIWDSIAEVPESLQLTDEQKIEIERRRAEYLADPSILVSWDEVKARIGL